MAQAEMTGTIRQESALAYSIWIHYLRGIAALAVLLRHLSSFMGSTLGDASLSQVFDVRFGIYGVAIFFAISGYLMAGLIDRYDPKTFLLHRALRIYPLFILTAILSYAIFLSVGSSLPLSFRTLLLAPIGLSNYPLGVEWTLIFEMSFYVGIFALSLVGGARLLPVIATIWLIGLAVAFASGAGNSKDLVHIWEIPLNFASTAFAAGLLIPTLIRWFDPRYLLPIALGALFVTGIGLPGTRFLSGFASAIIVACAVVGFGSFNPPQIVRRMLDWLGTSSYALYLCHVPTIRIVYYLGNGVMPPGALWLVACILSLAFATVLGKADIAMYERSKQILKRIGEHPSYVLAALFFVSFVSVSLLS